ncbi:MAG: hypothetical protein WBF13_11200 [Candidatus Zixiibacteriota bacterium]
MKNRRTKAPDRRAIAGGKYAHWLIPQTRPLGKKEPNKLIKTIRAQRADKR